MSLGRGMGAGGMGVHVYARIWVCGEACGVGLRKAACVEEAWTFVVYLTYYGLLHEHVCQTRSHNESRKSKVETRNSQTQSVSLRQYPNTESFN